MRRSHYIWMVGAAVLVAAFLVTLWLTAPGTRATILATHLVADESTLSDAAKVVGLQASDELKGYIDGVTRLNKDEAKIVGWAADQKGQGRPITILVFADGKNVLQTQTEGARPDVAIALKLSDAAASNVTFAGPLTCKTGQPLFVVAVAETSYAALGQRVCPP